MFWKCFFPVIFALSIFLAYCGASDIHIHRKPDKRKKRVACIGDSITNGAHIPNCFFRSYPAALQKLLGHSYQVENFGLNDRTLQSSANMPYIREREFTRSLAFKPDYAAILLGANDTKPYNWISEEHFMAEYRQFLKNYMADSVNVQIILLTPPWASDKKGPIASILNETKSSNLPYIVEAIKKLGKEYNLPVIDLYSLFYEKKKLFGLDNLHPNKRGAKLIAEQVSVTIKNQFC